MEARVRGNGRGRGRTHEYAPGDVGRDALGKGAGALVAPNPRQTDESVAVAEAVLRRLGTVSAHADENDLGRVAY